MTGRHNVDTRFGTLKGSALFRLRFVLRHVVVAVARAGPRCIRGYDRGRDDVYALIYVLFERFA